ncbi:MAG: DedA family protein [Chloroflexi bacterium AL-W]|nr:DedA family protein [Chloroflexi bacterium AL-N1]NOK70515.1 DedA family protein [Chloroflexi bacterium AL-N10]NOK78126.1 DedA family protein [Chloroflexi bacterium AL-N5]NOK85225.1 DedA family protein [Chloroflexi bacterium AL-W]NOK91990.1 DedA family protein [Chloroflexi bacterium AL-N15]
MDKPSLEHSTASSQHLSSVPPQQDRPAQRTWPWQSILLLLGTILLTIALLFVPIDVMDRLGAYGYLGVFLLTLLASASIVLPSPAVGVALIAGRTLDPWLVGITAGVAAGFGEITGYVAGLGGSTFAAQSRFYPRIERWVQRWGILTIFMLAVIPGPIFDLAGIAAGTMRMPFYRFLLACLLGKVLRFIGVAWVGALLGDISWFH